jgi:hypothetical protein
MAGTMPVTAGQLAYILRMPVNFGVLGQSAQGALSTYTIATGQTPVQVKAQTFTIQDRTGQKAQVFVSNVQPNHDSKAYQVDSYPNLRFYASPDLMYSFLLPAETETTEPSCPSDHVWYYFRAHGTDLDDCCDPTSVVLAVCRSKGKRPTLHTNYKGQRTRFCAGDPNTPTECDYATVNDRVDPMNRVWLKLAQEKVRDVILVDQKFEKLDSQRANR